MSSLRLPRPAWLGLAPSALSFLLLFFSVAVFAETVDDLSLEALLDMEVTSVSKKAQSLSDAPAAIFVISRDDIRRTGVRSIPEALRLVPGMHVGRIDSNKWAVASRGFNGRFANKLLVMIDGRTVYTPVFSGVYWESLNPMLEDIERIEVIRGPGAALWGANAVNGIINIITRHAADTQGGLLSVGAGNYEKLHGAIRYGAELAEGVYGRLYANGFRRGDFDLPDGNEGEDEWDASQLGFRVDAQLSSRDSFTWQGDHGKQHLHQHLSMASYTPPYLDSFIDSASGRNTNLLARWRHTLSPTSDFVLQLYWDQYLREEEILRQFVSTVDIDFQHRFALNPRNDLVWGLGARFQRDDLTGSVARARPSARTRSLYSAFAQDEITLREDSLWLTLGVKFEHNDYTGLEVQPTARLFWALNDRHKFWASVSRAVRTPSRVERSVSFLNVVLPPGESFNPGPFPIGVQVEGSEDFVSEELIAWELGYRFLAASAFSLDATLFYNDYQHLRSSRAGEVAIVPGGLLQKLPFSNARDANTWGAELAAVWQGGSWWRVDLAWSLLKTDIDTSAESDANPQVEISPEDQLSLRLALDVRPDMTLDLWLRYVGRAQALSAISLEAISLDAYTSLDVHLAWQVDEHLELSLSARNLFDDGRIEYVQESFTRPEEMPSGYYVGLRWDF